MRGTGNTVNNTVSSTDDPGFISDFTPTAYYSGGTSVPEWYNALGELLSLSSTWEFGMFTLPEPSSSGNFPRRSASSKSMPRCDDNPV